MVEYLHYYYNITIIVCCSDLMHSQTQETSLGQFACDDEDSVEVCGISWQVVVAVMATTLPRV